MSIDPEDPMRDYLIAKRKEEKALKKKKKGKSTGKHKNETPEERAARKAKKRAKKEKREKEKKMKSDGMKGVEELLKSLEKRDERIHEAGRRRSRSRSRHQDRIRSFSPDVQHRDHDRQQLRNRAPVNERWDQPPGGTGVQHRRGRSRSPGDGRYVRNVQRSRSRTPPHDI